MKHCNAPYGFPVVTNQETLLLINEMRTIRRVNDTTISVTYEDTPQSAFVGSWEDTVVKTADVLTKLPKGKKKKEANPLKQVQQKFMDI
jgi:hypothetical protein